MYVPRAKSNVLEESAVADCTTESATPQAGFLHFTWPRLSAAAISSHFGCQVVLQGTRGRRGKRHDGKDTSRRKGRTVALLLDGMRL